MRCNQSDQITCQNVIVTVTILGQQKQRGEKNTHSQEITKPHFNFTAT